VLTRLDLQFFSVSSCSAATRLLYAALRRKRFGKVISPSGRWWLICTRHARTRVVNPTPVERGHRSAWHVTDVVDKVNGRYTFESAWW